MGPSVEQDIWQQLRGQDIQLLGLDVYNGSTSQLQGYRNTTRVSFPLLQKAANGTSYGAGREDLVVIDRQGIVRSILNAAPTDNRKRIIDQIQTYLAQTLSPALSVLSSVPLGPIAFNQSTTQTLTINNTGTGTLSVTNIQSSSERVTISPTAFDVPAGEKRDLTITITASTKGDIVATLTIISNTPDNHTVTIHATVPNALPIAVNDTVRIIPNQRINIPVLQNDSDPDNDTLTLSTLTQGQNSESVIINTDQTVHYRPNPGFTGIDTFTYTFTDGWKGTATGTVTILIQEPVTNNQTLKGDFDGDNRVGFSDFLVFAQAFGTTDARYDLDGDARVGFSDFLIFAGLFGTASK